ncbi:hypothetical protein niasHS_016910 [Heterodera schachtii]|uniref:RRM domain-containing protein n=1 Tax=Heterodera schachtii TaxID=97005 RepID=A0ABD2HXV4_HETSC
MAQETEENATIYVWGLDEKVTEAILWELFVNAGPLTNVNMPKDRITGTHQGFGFVEFMSEEDADYAIKIMNMIKLFGKRSKNFSDISGFRRRWCPQQFRRLGEGIPPAPPVPFFTPPPPVVTGTIAPAGMAIGHSIRPHRRRLRSRPFRP